MSTADFQAATNAKAENILTAAKTKRQICRLKPAIPSFSRRRRGKQLRDAITGVES